MNNRPSLKPVVLLILSALLVCLLAGCGDSTNTPGVAATASQSPGLMEGQELKPAFAESKNLKLRYTSKPPHLTEKQVLGAIETNWAKTGADSTGRKVNITYTFGLATFGYFDQKAQTWIGYRNITLYNCTPDHKCTQREQKLDHIENRPMWFVDVDIPYLSASGCPNCPTPPNYNHLIHVVDDETGVAMYAWGYNAP